MQTLKYWGKRDKNLNLPTNSSISVTLSQDDLRTLTTAAADETFEKDQLWLNGKLESLDTPRTQACLADLRQLRQNVESTNSSLPKLSQMKLHIVSENNFPTAAGLASSAAGFAALITAIAKLFELPQDMSELSKIARKGSGSACRSLFGGFVAWEMGEEADGSDSLAVQVAPESHWPDLEALICVVSDAKKGTSSTAGMQSTIKTSTLMNERINQVVPERMEAMKKAILQKDFQSFAELTMRDSNQFHAVCLDTYPPIFYMNDTSRAIIQLIHEYNASSPDGRLKAAYTYDAGPNAVIYAPKKNMPEIVQLIGHYFPSNKEPSEFFADPYRVAQGTKLGEKFIPHPNFNENVIPVQPAGSVSRLLQDPF